MPIFKCQKYTFNSKNNLFYNKRFISNDSSNNNNQSNQDTPQDSVQYWQDNLYTLNLYKKQYGDDRVKAYYGESYSEVHKDLKDNVISSIKEVVDDNKKKGIEIPSSLGKRRLSNDNETNENYKQIKDNEVKLDNKACEQTNPLINNNNNESSSSSPLDQFENRSLSNFNLFES